MYWNQEVKHVEENSMQININMRCIEMPPTNWISGEFVPININMRCIEIKDIQDRMFSSEWININMRCIEMLWKNRSHDKQRRLTLTWDVLKYGLNAYLCKIEDD